MEELRTFDTITSFYKYVQRSEGRREEEENEGRGRRGKRGREGEKSAGKRRKGGKEKPTKPRVYLLKN